MSKRPNPTIQSFFPLVPKPITPPKNKHLPTPPPSSPWTPQSGKTYKTTKIGSIEPGPKRICFTGRIANFREQEKNSKKENAARLLIKMTIADETGVIDIKFWLTAHLRPSVQLGTLVKVHTTFVATLSAAEREKSAAKLMISISDTATGDNVEFLKEDEDNWADLRTPVGSVRGKNFEGLVPLKVFVETGNDIPYARVLVCVKWKGAKKQIPLKDGNGTIEKRDIGVFDDTMEATLSLWGSTISSPDSWAISETVLLLTNPVIKLWKRDVQLTLGHSSLVDINPIHRDTQWLRNYAKRLLRKPDICQPFPTEEFDWEEGLYGERRIRYTFADIDKYARHTEEYQDQLPTSQCIGWLNVVIVEMNVATLFRRNMLLCGSCCGFTLFTNSYAAECKKCDAPIQNLLPNPNIIGRLADETGSIGGNNIIWSPKAWQSLLGRTVKELAEETSKEAMCYFDDFFLFSRVNLAFGWDPEVGKIAVWDVVAS
ncbi:hypothetical protein BZA77DRAFT_349616 [Pyronema omphalodes]|nr:hypothetical protein BZA77DRAFT_349616 [Pyronema omphalodes]